MSVESVKYYIIGILVVVLVIALASFLGQGRLAESDKPRGIGNSTQAGRRPNVILITVDTLRVDHLSCYGYPQRTSPHIDQFAREALLFENCLSQAAETWSSCASILSGFLPHETKAMGNFSLPAGVETIAEMLNSQGYKTVAVISNYLLKKGRGYEQGFMIYDDSMNDRELVRRWPERIAEHTTNRAIELLKQFQRDHLFMWIHYQDPHGPYTPPEPFAKLFHLSGKKPRNLVVNTSVSGYNGIPSYQKLGANRDFYYYLSQYDGEIRYQDEHFKRLIDALREFDLYDHSLIIFTADHGEDMGEHNYFFTHGENLYSSLTHVPLIIRYGKELTGRKADFVQHIDIVPTILNFLGIKTNSSFRGRDLCKQDIIKKEIFAEMKSLLVKDESRFSLVLEGLKFISTPLYNQYELFDLKTDPHEKHNLIYNASYRERANDMLCRLERIRQEDFLQLGIVKKPLKLSEEERKKLRSLGYLQ